MRKIVVFLLLIFCTTGSYSQIKERDSLQTVLQTAKADTTRVMALANLSYLYFESNPDTGMTLALQAVELSRRIHFLKGEAYSLNAIGNVYNILGNYAKSMDNYLQALQINEKINNVEKIASNLNNIGNLYSLQNDFRQSLDYHLRAKALNEQLPDQSRIQDGISIVFSTIAGDYYRLKMYDSARLYAQKSYDLAYKISYSRMMGSALGIMGDIHRETGEYMLALEYYRLSIPHVRKAENFTHLNRNFMGMAKVFDKTGSIDSAIFYARLTIAIAEAKGFTRSVLESGNLLSGLFQRKHNVDSAFYYLAIARAANDSLFSQQKVKQFQSLAFDEKLRQQDLLTAEKKMNEERKQNLQYAAIAIALISFLIFFFVLSRSVIVNENPANFLQLPRWSYPGLRTKGIIEEPAFKCRRR
jgi:two-component system NtrC family sensor kinase